MKPMLLVCALGSFAWPALAQEPVVLDVPKYEFTECICTSDYCIKSNTITINKELYDISRKNEKCPIFKYDIKIYLISYGGGPKNTKLYVIRDPEIDRIDKLANVTLQTTSAKNKCTFMVGDDVKNREILIFSENMTDMSVVNACYKKVVEGIKKRGLPGY